MGGAPADTLNNTTRVKCISHFPPGCTNESVYLSFSLLGLATGTYTTGIEDLITLSTEIVIIIKAQKFKKDPKIGDFRNSLSIHRL